MNKAISLDKDQILAVLSLSQNATAIYVSDEIVIQTANDAMISFWGKDRRVIGKTLEKAVPELKGQQFIGLLQQVWRTGLTYTAKDTPAQLKVNGKLQTFFYDFEYRAVKNQKGEIYCILHTALDVTERVINRKALQKAEESEAAQMRALKENERNLRLIILQAPVAIAIFRGPDYVVEIANSRALELWGRKWADVNNQPILEAMPELKSQGIKELLDQVYHKGIPFSATEIPIQLPRNAKLETAYINFVYEPLYNTDGEINRLITVGTDVTLQFLARKTIEENVANVQAINEELASTNEELLAARLEEEKTRTWLEESERKLEMAVNSAEMGTWSVDPLNGMLTLSNKAKDIHGIRLNHDVTLKESFEMIHAEDRERVQSAIDTAIVQGKPFIDQYRISPMNGTNAKWLKSTGTAIFGIDGKAIGVSGTILDITKQKEQEQRKDDFISIASHELKTPVTSLKASLQLLDRMKETPSPAMLPKLVDQSLLSMNKITDLVDDLLNESRMSEGQLHLSKSTFTIAEMLEVCCNHVRVAEKHELVFQGDQQLQVYADLDRIDQVVVNFVNNAVKYAPSSSKIYLIVETVGNMAKVSVKDTGPGIPPEKIPYLFSRYYRADYTGAQYSGLGLGLYISAEIIKRHGGEIGVDSELGKGATFWFTLPLN